MINGNGVAYNLNSYLGPADLRTLTPYVVRTTILNPVLQDGPVFLEFVLGLLANLKQHAGLSEACLVEGNK
jgi:hypothetical protein